MGRPTYQFFPDIPSPPDEFKSFQDEFSSSMKWAVVGSLVYGVVVIVALILIVYAIIDCLKKLGSAVPEYAKLSTSDSNTEEASRRKVSSPDKEKVLQPDLPAESNSRVEYETVERFLSNIAREKPVRFSSAQLEEFTDNC